MPNKIELLCANCSSPFLKLTREHNRWVKQGRTRFFCGHSCAMTERNKTHPGPGNLTNLRPRSRDEHAPFRWFLLRAKAKDRRHRGATSLTLVYLSSVWNSQEGVCPITGWKLILPSCTSGWETPSPRNASLDRIDCSLGYVEGNVRFVSVMANLARNTYSDESLVEFCLAVAAHNSVDTNGE
jgi:hypothetical protein